MYKYKYIVGLVWLVEGLGCGGRERPHKPPDTHMTTVTHQGRHALHADAAEVASGELEARGLGEGGAAVRVELDLVVSE